MSAKDDRKKEILNYTIDELRLLYSSINSSFDNLRNKALALLAGEVAITTFIFTADVRQDNWFINAAAPVYGIVLFFVGVGLLVYAFGMFLAVISSAQWTHPPEERDVINPDSRFHNDPLEFLEYLKSEYLRAINHCTKVINARSRRFMHGVYSLSGGIIILILVKYGGYIIEL